MEETSAKVMEMVEMIPVTKAHALEDQEARKMSEQLRKVAEKGLQLDMIQTYFSSISWVAFQIFQVFCLAFTAYIARAFLRNPKILILDEATSALDSISEKKIQDSIQKLVKGRTTLIVAHRLSTIRNADRIAVIGKGNVLECGSYEELIEKKGTFYRMEKM